MVGGAGGWTGRVCDDETSVWEDETARGGGVRLMTETCQALVETD